MIAIIQYLLVIVLLVFIPSNLALKSVLVMHLLNIIGLCETLFHKLYSTVRYLYNNESVLIRLSEQDFYSFHSFLSRHCGRVVFTFTLLRTLIGHTSPDDMKNTCPKCDSINNHPTDTFLSRSFVVISSAYIHKLVFSSRLPSSSLIQAR